MLHLLRSMGVEGVTLDSGNIMHSHVQVTADLFVLLLLEVVDKG